MFWICFMQSCQVPSPMADKALSESWGTIVPRSQLVPSYLLALHTCQCHNSSRCPYQPADIAATCELSQSLVFISSCKVFFTRFYAGMGNCIAVSIHKHFYVVLCIQMLHEWTYPQKLVKSLAIHALSLPVTLHVFKSYYYTVSIVLIRQKTVYMYTYSADSPLQSPNLAISYCLLNEHVALLNLFLCCPSQ